MNILLLGKSGQVGWELQRSLSVLGRVTALGHDEADFTQPQAVAQTVRALRPDVIVNAAAHTAVDKAEGEPARARLLNATTPGVLAEEAARLGAWLVHYSTDYVFDGSGDRPWVETDAPRRSTLRWQKSWQAPCCPLTRLLRRLLNRLLPKQSAKLPTRRQQCGQTVRTRSRSAGNARMWLLLLHPMRQQYRKPPSNALGSGVAGSTASCWKPVTVSFVLPLSSVS